MVAWMRMMGADSVAYHAHTVAGRADDHAAAALAYYGSRGETPLRWGGSGAAGVGLSGEVSADAYRAVFGPGGARNTVTGVRLVAARRPGIELVVSPHKSVAELGVIGRADDMHAIADAERDATLAYLDGLVRQRGGRRGRAATSTATGGLVWATTRHATTRAGDPQIHDHVLVANIVSMRDERGGWKGLDTAFVRDHLHAATAVGRLAAARRAVELGYAIEPDGGPSGRLGSWSITGIPPQAWEVHATRAGQIDAEVGADASYQARQIAARTTRDPKTRQAVEGLVGRWRAELAAHGYPPAELAAAVEEAGRQRGPLVDRLEPDVAAGVVGEVLGIDGPLAQRKVFTRGDLIVAVAPYLHGLPVTELDNLVDQVVRDRRCVPLIGVAGARERVWAPACVLAHEHHVAALAEQLAHREGAPRVSGPAAHTAITNIEADLDGPLTAGQRAAAVGVLTSGRGLDLIVGVAGAGKTTALAVVAAGFDTAGYTVIGTATSGQATRSLAGGAGIDQSRTVTSLLWRLDHYQLTIGDRHVLVLDESGMTDDIDLGRLLAAAVAAGAKIVVVGDDRQLGAIGPGGGLGALLARHPERIWPLADNVRQIDVAERDTLAQLRAGHLETAVDWYGRHDRIRAAPTREAALSAMVAAWAADTGRGVDAVMVAYRRDNVAALNHAAQAAMRHTGRLTGPQLHTPDGHTYQAGDPIILLAPGPGGLWVTGERAVVSTIDTEQQTLTALTGDRRRLHLKGEQLRADRVTLGYAVTAHRTQGATHDVVHALEDGGGRELAYVKMSRARHTSHIYLAAPTPEDAADRLIWAWQTERRPQWAIDQTRVDVVAQLRQRRDTLTAAIPPDPTPVLHETRRRLAELENDWDDLHRGTGRWAGTPAGDAARQLGHAHHDHQVAVGHAHDPRLGPIARRRARRHEQETAQKLGDAQQRWEHDGAPHAQQLAGRHHAVQTDIARHQQEVNDRLRWLGQHPDLIRQLNHIDHQIAEHTRPHPTHLDPADDNLHRAPRYPEPPTPQREVDRDYGLGW